MNAKAEVQHPAPTLGERLVSVILWTIGLLWLVPMMATMMLVAIFVPSDRTDWLNRLYCWGQIRATGARYEVVVHPDVDPEQVYIFACNHVNLLDHVTMYNSTPHFKQGVELASHFKIPVYGWFMRQRGTIAVHRGQGKIEQLTKDVKAEVERGHSILVFPEGTRTLDGRVGRFRKGFFRIARDLELSVVPVSVTGMYEILRKGSSIMRPGDIVTVHCDAPVSLAGMTNEELDVAIAKIRDQVAGHVDRHMDGADA